MHKKNTYSPFPPNKLWFLNRFRSGFLEPWCYLANQPAFPPVLSGTIVMKDASSTEGVAQCTLNLENDTPTDVITVRKENLLFFGSSWEPTFRVPNQFIFGRNAPNGSKLGARTGTEPVPCWWKRANSGLHKYWQTHYSASGKYSQRFTFSTFCYVTALFQKLIKFIFFLKILHTIPHNDNMKNVFLRFLQMY